MKFYWAKVECFQKKTQNSIALYYSIDEDGQDVLDSVGCDAMGGSVTYDVMTYLRNTFGTKKTIYVKTQIVVTAS